MGWAVVLGLLVLPMSVGLGWWGRLVYNGSTCTQVPKAFSSVGQVCMACLFVVEPVYLPWAISHLAATSAIPATYFSGQDLGTFWPGIGRDEPPCRIQSVIWYLVLHTHPHAAQGTAWYIRPGPRFPSHTHAHSSRARLVTLLIVYCHTLPGSLR